MASSAKRERKYDSPRLLSVRKIDEKGRVKISFRTVRGRSARAVFAANDDVEGALDRWNASGMLEAPDRKILDGNSIEGWTAGPMGGQKQNANDRLKEAHREAQEAPAEDRPVISPKQARLAKEAKLLAAYKDDYRAYWVVIAIVTVLTFVLLGATSGLR